MVRSFMFVAASAALARSSSTSIWKQKASNTRSGFRRITTAMLGLAMALAPIAGAKAAELKVLAGGSMTDSLREIGPQFEHATGHKLVFLFAGTPELIRQATSGAPFDLGVVPIDVMKDAAARAKFGPTTDISRVGYGVAFKSGAPKPDVGTPDAMKAALLQARSVALYPESAAGAYVMKTFDRLGIGEAMKAKTKPQPPGQIATAVANGDAELGLFLTNLLIAPGVEFAGPFPAELQNDLVFVGAVAADSKEADAAKAFVAYLKTPEAAAVFKAKGVKPG
jgi:molybdate transport system substrate-binding protein